jgi:hypothetical protein
VAARPGALKERFTLITPLVSVASGVSTKKKNVTGSAIAAAGAEIRATQRQPPERRASSTYQDQGEEEHHAAGDDGQEPTPAVLPPADEIHDSWHRLPGRWVGPQRDVRPSEQRRQISDYMGEKQTFGERDGHSVLSPLFTAALFSPSLLTAGIVSSRVIHIPEPMPLRSACSTQPQGKLTEVVLF